MADAERDTLVGPRTDPSPDAVQSSSSEPVTSATRPAPSTEPAAGSDTLLSVPAAATREDLQLDQRIAACERRLEELELRLGAAEERRRERAPAAQRQWSFWLVFLAGLALAWQVLERLR